MVVVEEPLLFAAVWVVAPLVDAFSICRRLSIPPPPPCCACCVEPLASLESLESLESSRLPAGVPDVCPPAALACSENSACRICGPNCGPPADDAVEPVEPDEPVEDDDELLPLPWPSAANSADNGLDCVDVLLACESCCQSDCR